MVDKPPHTDNLYAAMLIQLAQAKCEYCRTHWRLGKNSFVHRGNGMTCQAQDERAKLRALVADRFAELIDRSQLWQLRLARVASKMSVKQLEALCIGAEIMIEGRFKDGEE